MRPQQTSAFFRADLGLLDTDGETAFSKWAEATCKHYVMRTENDSTVFYATRAEGKTKQQYRNTMRALASNHNIALTILDLTLMEKEEYQAQTDASQNTDGRTSQNTDGRTPQNTDGRASQTDGPPMSTPQPRATPPHDGSRTSCGGEWRALLSEDFDERSKRAYNLLIATRKRWAFCLTLRW